MKNYRPKRNISREKEVIRKEMCFRQIFPNNEVTAECPEKALFFLNALEHFMSSPCSLFFD